MAPRDDLMGRFMADARQLGWMVMHSTDSRTRATVAGRKVLIADPEAAGWPTLFLVHKSTGRAMGVVIARELEKLTGDQERWIEALDAAGVETQVVRPSNELAALGSLHRLVAA